MKLRAPEKRPCKRCGKEFTDDPANHPNSPHFKRQYCGYDCRTAAKRDHLRATAAKRRKPILPITRTCVICKEEFTWQPKQHATRNLELCTCSKKCARKLRMQNMPPRVCRCGQSFKLRSPGQINCSVACNRRYNPPKQYSASHRRQRIYGLNQVDYDRMLQDQEGVCKICLRRSTRIRMGKLLPLAVDHDHQTGKVRGLLCNSCNTAIGLLHDNIVIARRLANYLIESNPSIKQQTLHSDPLT